MMAITKRGAPDSGPKIQAGTCNSESPTTPPRPVGSGQDLLGARHDANPAAAIVPATQRIARMRCRSSGRCVSSRQPHEATGSSSATVAMPRICIIRSALAAPTRPSALRTGALVAWLNEGSCTDQVASASAAMPAMPITPMPTISRTRRRAAARRSSETMSPSERL